MELTSKERLVLIPILPMEEHIITLKVVRDIKNRVGFTAEEIEKLNFRTEDDGRTLWDDAVPPMEYEFTGGEIAIIASELKKLEEAEPSKLHEDHITLYEKFVE